MQRPLPPEPLSLPPGPHAAYLFDLDGTVADSMPLHFVAWTQAVAEHGGSFPEPLFYQMGGIPLLRTVELLNERFGTTMVPELVVGRKEALYLDMLAELKPVASVLAVIELNAGRVPFAIVSGSPRVSIDATLRTLGLSHYFPVIVGAEDYRRGKPDPEPFLTAAAALGVPPRECLVFEDAEAGIASAIAAGMEYVRIPHPLLQTASALDGSKTRSSSGTASEPHAEVHEASALAAKPMRTLKGPALFLAQFAGDQAPFNSLDGLAEWAAGLGFKAVQVPAGDKRLFDLQQAAESQAYCDNLRGRLAGYGLELSELSTHLEGQLVAVHPAYDALFDGFAPANVHGDEPARRAWAIEQLKLAARASRNLGLTAHASFSGALAWPYFYPWPQRPAGLVEEAFSELSRRWRPILDQFDEAGVDLCFELHPGEDLHDGATFERFLEATGVAGRGHARAKILYDPSHFLLQQLDYLDFLDRYHPYIGAFHVKDAEFRPSGRAGVYGGYLPWVERPGRFRTAGRGQIDFGAIFAKLAQYGYAGWPVLEWEDPLQAAADGAREGAQFIARQILQVTDRAFDDFAASDGGAEDARERMRSILGLTGREKPQGA